MSRKPKRDPHSEPQYGDVLENRKTGVRVRVVHVSNPQPVVTLEVVGAHGFSECVDRDAYCCWYADDEWAVVEHGSGVAGRPSTPVKMRARGQRRSA